MSVAQFKEQAMKILFLLGVWVISLCLEMLNDRWLEICMRYPIVTSILITGAHYDRQFGRQQMVSIVNNDLFVVGTSQFNMELSSFQPNHNRQ